MFVALLAAAAVQAAQPAAPPADAAAAAAQPPPAAAKASDPDRVVCTSEKEIGSLFTHRVCVRKSVADDRRQNDREILDKNQKGPLKLGN